MQHTLIHFTCACSYSEPIGVDPRCGVILEGTITLICPKCGRIHRMEGVKAIVPVRLEQPAKPQ